MDPARSRARGPPPGKRRSSNTATGTWGRDEATGRTRVTIEASGFQFEGVMDEAGLGFEGTHNRQPGFGSGSESSSGPLTVGRAPPTAGSRHVRAPRPAGSEPQGAGHRREGAGGGPRPAQQRHAADLGRRDPRARQDQGEARHRSRRQHHRQAQDQGQGLVGDDGGARRRGRLPRAGGRADGRRRRRRRSGHDPGPAGHRRQAAPDAEAAEEPDRPGHRVPGRRAGRDLPSAACPSASSARRWT